MNKNLRNGGVKMRTRYKAEGNKIIQYDDYEQWDIAICEQPEKAIKLFERGHYLNDVKRQYTASARLFAQAEQLPGFQWTPPDKEAVY